MKWKNNASFIKKDLFLRLIRLFDQGRDAFVAGIDRVPLEMTPRHAASFRCCVHHDRAVLRRRVLAFLGFRVEEEEDELKPLADYAREAFAPRPMRANVLTVIDDACDACVRANYLVTNACRGCVARPCIMNCPKEAISMVDGRARINEQICVSCGICAKVCPYHAIIYQAIPCEASCPVDAITQDDNGKDQIAPDRCVHSGHFVQACPFGALYERVIGALHELGFDAVIEVAAGADQTARLEAREFIHAMQGEKGFMTSSCCPAWFQTVARHLPQLQPHVSSTKTPLRLSAEQARQGWPDAQTVFVGPCVAKRSEALEIDEVDYVMTFEELQILLEARAIDPDACAKRRPDVVGSPLGRGFASSGGVKAAIAQQLPEGVSLNPFFVDGLKRKILPMLKSFAARGCPGNFVEVMCCQGGCLNGPGVIVDPELARKRLQTWAEASGDVSPPPEPPDHRSR